LIHPSSRKALRTSLNFLATHRSYAAQRTLVSSSRRDRLPDTVSPASDDRSSRDPHAMKVSHARERTPNIIATWSSSGAPAVPVGRVNAASRSDAPSLLAPAVRGDRPGCVRARGAGSFASPRHQGRRYAARCARSCRAALDRAASLRWMAMRVARTRNLPKSCESLRRWDFGRISRPTFWSRPTGP
jgi:hypothetical protein